MKRKMHILDPFETFLGPMRSQLADYVNEKRALGKDFGSEIKTLRSFDRFVVAEGYEQIGLTEDLYWRWERSNPKDIKPNTLGHRIRTIAGFALYLKRNDYQTFIPPSPRGVRYCRSFYVPYIFTLDELRRLITACDTMTYSHAWHNAPVVFPVILRVLIGCGTRIGETLSMRMEDVDSERRIITILNGKGGKDRLIGVSEDVIKSIRELCKRIHPGEDEGLIFTMADGNPYTRDCCYRIFRKQLWRAGIPHGGKDKGPRLHDLRHTYATLTLRQLVNSGVRLQTALQYLAAQLGHYSSSVTERYVHFCPDLVPLLAETIEGIASRVIPMEVKHEQ